MINCPRCHTATENHDTPIITCTNCNKSFFYPTCSAQDKINCYDILTDRAYRNINTILDLLVDELTNNNILDEIDNCQVMLFDLIFRAKDI